MRIIDALLPQLRGSVQCSHPGSHMGTLFLPVLLKGGPLIEELITFNELS